MSHESPLIDVVLIPLAGGNVLLPNVCVAEILPWRRLTSEDGAPPWQLGVLRWREREIAVVSLEAVREGTVDALPAGEHPRCLVVMNRLRIGGDVEFYGIAADGLPRLLHLADEDLEVVASGDGARMLEVRLGTESAFVPDLEWLEERISESVPAH